ncbi:MAG: TVP38/TMEM64 family protein [Phycisphaeraceae bacterium]|nr:MAG: TVP38/TMEM64 family protein [Phycisphaeraceae bacterium]
MAEPAHPESFSAIFKRLGPAAWLGILWALLPAIGGFTLLAFVGPVSEWLRAHETAGIAAYVAIFIAAAGLGFLPTYAQAFVGGWAFGPVTGTIAALSGFVGAAVVGYFIARTVGRDRVESEIQRNVKARAVRDALVGAGTARTLGIVTLVRIPPNSPFSITNLVLSTTGVPLWIYIVATAVGMLPRTALVVWLASQVQGALTRETIKGAQPKWVLYASIAVAVGVLFLLVHIGNKAIEKVTGGSQNPEEPQATTEEATAASPGDP